ncbi:Crp/Fnr family transcriptional regulator [Telluribacter sp. SYSU D00476]|uniref:Crp/Fnr family transcriptional regulator n=1 Tax=Telluribacter sp. SYSU D00476 TaxID=2811430 RepID=UPI001FF1348E|nr:Crp/Fnr family transcriptional regulator [Telluribacter sp. SYSU D00476]
MLTNSEPLRQVVMSLYPLKEQEVEEFLAIWKPQEVKRKVLLTAKGDTEKYLYFVLDGLQRVYYADDLDREATLVFNYTHQFGGVIDSFLFQQPSRYYYETLTPSLLLKASFQDLDRLMLQYPSIERMIRIGVSGALSGVLERLVELQSFSSEERFKTLLKRSPHILQLVPHKYLASYLSVDPTNFSKLLNKVRI